MNDTYIFFGRSGAGKGTQARLLKGHFENHGEEVLYIENGQRFRNFVKSDSYTAAKTKELIEGGNLAPVFLPIWMWTQGLIDEYTGKEKIIFDGICRRPEESAVLDSALGFYDFKNRYIVDIHVSREWATERLMDRGRGDDKAEEINKRLDWYDEFVIPAIQYFENNPDYTYLSVDGEQAIEDIHQDLVQKLNGKN